MSKKELGAVASFAKPDLAEFFRTYAIATFNVNQNETRIAFATNLGGQAYNVWGLDLDGSPYPYPLSHVDQLPGVIKQDPQGRYILSGFDTNGNELMQLYLLPPRGGSLVPLKTEEKARFMNPVLSEDGNRVYFTTDRDQPQFLSGFRLDMQTGEETLLFNGEGAPTALLDVAPDESSFLVAKSFANTYQPGYVVKDGTWKSLVPDPDTVYGVNDLAYLDPDRVVFTCNYQKDASYLALYTLSTDEFEVLGEGSGDMTLVAPHKKTGEIYVVASSGVEDQLYRYRPTTGDLMPESLPVAVVEGLRVGESGTLYLLGRSDVAPLNLWRRRPGEDWTRLTNNQVMGMAEEALAPAEVVHFSSFDGLQIEALWFAARPENANGYTIIWPHGGPQAAERKMFRPFFQFALARGYNIWAPNFRGSTGYGAAFMKMVNRDWGDGPRRDMMASVDWLVESGRAEADKLFVVGGSYGGYMTLLLHGRHGDRFRAFVDLFGPSNLFTFVNSVPEFWKAMMREWLGDPGEDRERLTQDSPITYLSHMTKPMLVVQGANDPRVVKAESDQIVEALRQRGVPVEYVVFDDEGHGFMKKENEIQAYRQVVEFLDRHRN